MPDLRLLYLSRADVERVALDMRTIIDLLDAAFREKAAGRVEMPPKPGVHPHTGRLHPRDAGLYSIAPLGRSQVGGGLSRQSSARPALHLRPRGAERRRHGPALRGDGLHVDHRQAHRRGVGPVRATPGAARERHARHPGLRRARAARTSRRSRLSSRCGGSTPTTSTPQRERASWMRCGPVSASRIVARRPSPRAPSPRATSS